MPSMSPASSAATWAAGSLMKRKTTLCSLILAASRKPSQRTSVTAAALLPAVQLEGPVPTGLVAAVAALAGCRMTAVFSPRRKGSVASALFSVRITVCAVGVCDAADVVEHRLLGLVGAAGRLGALEAELDTGGVERRAV
jgi:hypothetical protein